MKKYLIPILLGITILSTSVAIIALGSTGFARNNAPLNENWTNDTRQGFNGMMGQSNWTNDSRQGTNGRMGQSNWTNSTRQGFNGMMGQSNWTSGTRQGFNGMMGQYQSAPTAISTDLTGSDYTKVTLKAALDVVLADEYKARAEYQAIVDKFGAVSPYVQLINAETRHIAALSRVYDAFGFTILADNGAASAVVPSTVEAGYQIGIDAEKANIALYANYLNTDLPTSIERIFTNLQNASENHLAIFTAAKNGEPLTSYQGCYGTRRRFN